MASGIYGIRSKTTGKWYVGQAQDIEYRLYQHRYLLSRGKDNSYLRHAFQKYGPEDFEVTVLEYCAVDQLDERERYWISQKDSYLNGYNFTIGGRGNRGWNASEETRRFHSELTKAQWENPEIRKKRIDGMLKSFSHPSYRLKISASSRKNWSLEHYRARMREAARSSWADQTQRKRRMDSLKNVMESQAYRDKMRERTSSLWKDDKYRSKTNSARNAAMRSEEYRSQKRAEMLTRLKCDQAFSDKCLESLSKAWDTIRVPVLQVETGIVFSSSSEAAESIGVKSHSHITSVCTGKRVTAYGYHWRYASDTEADWNKRHVEHLNHLKNSGGRGFRERRVVCVETGEIFPTAKSAAESIGVDPSNITKACKGSQASAGGYHWRYEED